MSNLPAADVWRDRCSALSGTIEEMQKAAMDHEISYDILKEDRDRCHSEYKRVLEERIEAENLLSSVLMTLDAIKIAELKHGRALTDAWGHHWRRQANEPTKD